MKQIVVKQKMNKITIACSQGLFKKLVPGIRKALRESLELLSKKNCAVDLYLITAQEMKRLNRAFRGKNKPTTVLSFAASPNFPCPDMKKPLRHIGEIYLAPQVILSTGETLHRFAIHGLLHLLGYTHARVRDRIRMERIESRLLNHDHRT